MTRIKIGVDNGNYNTKSSERMLYASGFAMSDKEFITSDMQLFYGGRILCHWRQTYELSNRTRQRRTMHSY